MYFSIPFTLIPAWFGGCHSVRLFTFISPVALISSFSHFILVGPIHVSVHVRVIMHWFFQPPSSRLSPSFSVLVLSSQMPKDMHFLFPFSQISGNLTEKKNLTSHFNSHQSVVLCCISVPVSLIPAFLSA